jgi:type II secretory pathway component PulJ
MTRREGCLPGATGGLRRPGRRGATLVELLVFAGLAALPFAVIWNFWVSGSRQSVRMEGRMLAIQAVPLTLETMRDDLARLVSAGTRATTGTAEACDGGEPDHCLTLTRFVSYEPDARELYGPDAASTAWLKTEQITYRFNPEAHRLERNGRPVGSVRFLDVRLRLEGSQVHVKLVLCPDDLLDRPEPPPESVRTELNLRLGLPQQAALQAYPGWVGNYFDRPRQVPAAQPR